MIFMPQWTSIDSRTAWPSSTMAFFSFLLYSWHNFTTLSCSISDSKIALRQSEGCDKEGERRKRGRERQDDWCRGIKIYYRSPSNMALRPDIHFCFLLCFWQNIVGRGAFCPSDASIALSNYTRSHKKHTRTVYAKLKHDIVVYTGMSDGVRTPCVCKQFSVYKQHERSMHVM